MDESLERTLPYGTWRGMVGAVNPLVNPDFAVAPSPAVRTRGRRRAMSIALSVGSGPPLPEGIDMPRTPERIPRHAPDVRIGCDVHPVAEPPRASRSSASATWRASSRRSNAPSATAMWNACADVSRPRRLCSRCLQLPSAARRAVASIEVRTGRNGVPFVVLSGAASELAATPGHRAHRHLAQPRRRHRAWPSPPPSRRDPEIAYDERRMNPTTASGPFSMPTPSCAARLPTWPTRADLYAAGMTSHASVNVMLALEDAFDIEFPDELLTKSHVLHASRPSRDAVPQSARRSPHDLEHDHLAGDDGPSTSARRRPRRSPLSTPPTWMPPRASPPRPSTRAAPRPACSAPRCPVEFGGEGARRRRPRRVAAAPGRRLLVDRHDLRDAPQPGAQPDPHTAADRAAARDPCPTDRVRAVAAGLRDHRDRHRRRRAIEHLLRRPRTATGCTLVKNAPVISYGEQADLVLVTARRDADSAPSDQVLVACDAATAARSSAPAPGTRWACAAPAASAILLDADVPPSA